MPFNDGKTTSDEFENSKWGKNKYIFFFYIIKEKKIKKRIKTKII